MHRRTLAVALSAAFVLGVLNGIPATGQGFETNRVTETISPGLTLTQFDRYEPEGWIRGDVLTADLTMASLRPEYLSPDRVAAATPLSEQVDRSGAVAGVNGDFFDIDKTNAPLGAGVDDGQLRHASAEGHNEVAAVGERAGRLMRVFLDAKFTRQDGTTTPVTDLNTPEIAPNGIALYNSLWGAASRRSVIEGARRVTEVEVTNGVVTRISAAPAEGPVPRNAVRLLGVGSGADTLRTLRKGERLSVDYRPRGDGTSQVAIGGNKTLLRDGRVRPVDDTEAHPRTAVGFSADGRRMWLVTIDGRQADSRGMTERELARELRSLGADDALNLDGGGSSSLLAREQGEGSAKVHNSPSDGQLRPVPNGIGFSVVGGSGRLTGFQVEPAADTADGQRVFAGLTRRLRAHGHDETGSAVRADPEWASSSGHMTGATFHAARPGQSEVVAHRGAASGRTRLSVLGPLSYLDSSVERLALSGTGESGRFRITGSDAEGFRTWVEPSDVRLEYDPAKLRIHPSGDGFEVTALAETASTVTARVGDKVTRFGVTAGSRPQQLSNMDTVKQWRASTQPDAVGAALSQAEGRSDGTGLALDYALTGSDETRAAYVNTAQRMRLPSGTQRLGMWVNGDGRGGWLRANIVDSGGGAGTTVDLARNVDWRGWRYVEAAIPPGVSDQASLQRFYVVEPDPERQYQGRLVFDDLTAAVAPEVDVPPDPEQQDASVVRDGTLPPEQGTSRVAVVSDAQFTADDPTGPLVRQARRSLRAALASDPDMVVINGDFVDRGTAADLDLAREVINSELGDRVPWHYVPGNHETYGTGDLGEFREEFGATHRVVDSGTNRYVFLNSARGSLRAGGFEQIRMLRRALDTAKTDPGVRSVSVFMHHPIEDPGTADTSELEDPKEAELLNSWLTDFERSSRKPAVAVTAHAGAFHASAVDGVPYLVNGNAGKAPSLSPEQGGFTGSSLLGIDPDSEGQPVRWETKPHVDDVRLITPPRLAVGQQRQVRAEVIQGDRVVPVAYPVSADWYGSPSVHIGPPEQAGSDQVAAVDPATGEMTGLRPGRGVLRLNVNGVIREAPFEITG